MITKLILFIILLLVAGADFISSKFRKNGSEELIVPGSKKKSPIIVNRKYLLYLFPLLLIIISFFIDRETNISIYNITGYLYETLLTWFIIFYYVTIFSYKSVNIKGSKNVIVASEILYFFTLVFLTITINLTTNHLRDSYKLIVNSKVTIEKGKCATPNMLDNKGDRFFVFKDLPEGYIDCTKNDIVETTYYRTINIYKAENNIMIHTAKTDYYYDYKSLPLKNLIYDFWIFIFDSFDTNLPHSLLFNIFLVGYIWRVIFSSILWSFNTIKTKN